MKVISRAQAQSQSAKRYFTGKPCKHGHISERETVNGSCVECKKLRMKQWKAKNTEAVSEYNAAHYKQDIEHHRSRAAKWRAENPEAHKAAKDAWVEANRDKLNARRRERFSRRYREDYDFKCRNALRSLLHRTLNLTGRNKHSRTEEMIGYSAEELRAHIERQFTKGMGWHNRSEWHIDHITPIDWFVENGITDPKRINCLSNLKPIWARENLCKQKKLTTLL